MFHSFKVTRFIPFIFILVSACASSRPPIPPGVVPSQEYITAEEEQYGQDVLNSLTEEYELERDDTKVNRVRDIVTKLAKAAKADKSPWNVFVFKDDTVVNAAATRGNYVFVWSGMLRVAKTEPQLATVLAHELGHVLAGHPKPTPEEEAAEIIASTTGQIASEVLSYTDYGALADLAGMLVSEIISAAVVNPESQRKELEADQIGLFLMADAKYDPNEAIKFWQMAAHDPAFGSQGLEFLSTHPSSEERSAHLAALLPEALVRYKGGKSAPKSKQDTTGKPVIVAENKVPPVIPPIDVTDKKDPLPPPVGQKPANERFPELPELNPKDFPVTINEPEKWQVKKAGAAIYLHPDRDAPQLETLKKGTKLDIVDRVDDWFRVEKPSEGWVNGGDLERK